MRWILVDRYETIQKGKYCKGIRSVSRSEGALVDYHPCYPFMPSSLMVEMMAQVGGVLVGATIDFKKEVVLAKLANADFTKTIAPPALLEIEANLLDCSDHAGMTECKILHEGSQIAHANIFFALFDRLNENGEESRVFSKDFMETFAIQQLIQESQPA